MLEHFLHSIRLKVLHLSLKMTAKKRLEKDLQLSDCWQGIYQCVVCWPEEGVDTAAADIIFRHLRKKFPGAGITVIESLTQKAYPPEESVRVVSLSKTDFNFMGFPKSSLKMKLQSINADIAIDLSAKFNPLTAYCCEMCGAKVKVGFALPDSELVFNFQVLPNSERKGADRYKVLASYIG